MTNDVDYAKGRLKRLASDFYLSDERFRISYFIPHPDQNLEEASPFQGATQGMVDTVRLLEGAILLPADVREIASSWRHIAFFRASGLISHRILPAEYSAFRQLVSWPNLPPFRCVISSDESADFVEECLSFRRDTWLHLSSQPAEGRFALDRLPRRVLCDYVKQRIDQLEGDAEYGVLAKYVRPLLSANLPGTRRISLPCTMHNLTRPNELGLMAFGCKLPDGPESPMTEKGSAHWIMRSVDFVDRQRRELLTGEQRHYVVNALLLTLPAMYRGRRKQDIVRLFRQAIGTAKVPTGRLVRDFINQKSYLWHAEYEELQDFLASPLGHALIAIRRDELNLYTAILTRISAESLLPAIRLSPKSNSAWGHLKQLADCARSDGPHKNSKMRRLLATAQSGLESGFDERIKEKLRFVGNRAQGIKLVCDLPLEWVRINGVPLMLRHDCSRIPTVPSSLGYAAATDQSPLFIPPSQLTNILVIRSFSETDRIRLLLERAVNAILDKECTWRVTVSFVDVETTQQLIDALNGHTGAIVIFDCHGSFETNDYLSTLIIGGELIPLWEIRKQIRRMPPIVLLSACDTLPVDGSHASAALSMLQLGARTVLATLLPIDSRKAAIFLARLIYRIGEFVPVVTKSRIRISWREVVSGMIRMMHVTECLWRLMDLNLLDHDSFGELQLKANVAINNRDPNWFEHIVKGLATRIQCSEAEAMAHLTAGIGLSDAMMHVQLGNPELLWVIGDEAETAFRDVKDKPAADVQIGGQTDLSSLLSNQ